MIDTLIPKRTPFQHFLTGQKAAGILLLISAVLAMICANTGLQEWYFHLKHMDVGLSTENLHFHLHLEEWVNDALMVVFFFVVGLEIKREVLIGELSSPKKAALSAYAAVGGMIVPAGIYFLFARHHPDIQHGWGIPMATDIAFAIGVLSLLGDRVPLGMKVFLTALAIVDDLGAIIVIAVFYSEELRLGMLGLSIFMLIVSYVYGRTATIRRGPVYALIGIFCWYFMLQSGIHATIAGVLMAMTIPMDRKIKIQDLNDKLRAGLGDGSFQVSDKSIKKLEYVIRVSQRPLNRFENSLHKWVSYFIMPLFAFFNAGVTIPLEMGLVASAPEVHGIVFGLILGKPLGVVLASLIAVRLGYAALPEGMNWFDMAGVGLLAGIGFTMSLFIAALAFDGHPEYMDHAKMAILIASIVAATAGILFCCMSVEKKPPTTSDGFIEA